MTSHSRAAEALSPKIRYTAADFYRLSNGVYAASPSPDPDTAGNYVAERTGVGQSVDTADKRLDLTTSSCSHQVQVPHPIRGHSPHCCIREESSGIAQSFLESSITHRLPHGQDRNEVGIPSKGLGHCHYCCRCGRVSERRSSDSKPQRRSRSFSPPRVGISELSGLERIAIHDAFTPKVVAPAPCRRGEAPLENLPVEILDRIIAQLTLEVPQTTYTARKSDLVSCLLTSRSIHAATISTLYAHIIVRNSEAFSKFLGRITQLSELGYLVRRLDLSQFSSVGLKRTRQKNSEVQNLTSETLLRCLELTPCLQEVLLQEHIEDDIDQAFIGKLFFGLPNLQAVDFCAASSSSFVEAFSAVVNSLTPSTALSIRRMSLHECFTLPSLALDALLPCLPRLTHLDLSHTRVTDKALTSIPSTARITHLNLGRCAQITGQGVVKFLSEHPAVGAIIYLNLACDVSRYRLLWEVDVDRLLPILPSTLRSLNLSGAKVSYSHLPLLIPLTKHLEELSIGFTELSMSDINSLFVPQTALDDDSDVSDEELNWMPSTLYYLDLTGIPSVTQSALFSSSCILLSPATSPLEVLELSDKAISALKGSRKSNKQVGWLVQELGRRAWYVREPTGETQRGTRGRKSWKMGARWWGSRKVPVVWGEIGGLMGFYMFKK